MLLVRRGLAHQTIRLASNGGTRGGIGRVEQLLARSVGVIQLQDTCGTNSGPVRRMSNQVTVDQLAKGEHPTKGDEQAKTGKVLDGKVLAA